MNKYLEKIAETEKYASLLAGTGIAHLAQNAITSVALRSKTVSKHLANTFTQGYYGVIASGVKDKVLRTVTSVISPDLSVMGKTLHEAGGALRSKLPDISKRHQVALRMLSEGRFSDIKKYKLHESPGIHTVLSHIDRMHGTQLVDKVKRGATEGLEKLWSDSRYPLLKNISKNLSRGTLPKTHTPGAHSSSTGIITNTLGATLEPGAGVLGLIKHLTSSEKFRNNPIGAKISGIAETMLIKNPIKAGWDTGESYREGLKTKAMEHLLTRYLPTLSEPQQLFALTLRISIDKFLVRPD